MSTAEGQQQTLKEIFGGIAHEINNPLSIIYGKSAQLKRKVESNQLTQEQIISDLEKIEAMSERISKVIKNFSSFLKSENDNKIERVHLESLLNQCLVLCTERFRNQGIQLKIQAPSNTEMNCIEADLAYFIINQLIWSYKVCVEQNSHQVDFIILEEDKAVSFELVFSEKVNLQIIKKEALIFKTITNETIKKLNGSVHSEKQNSICWKVPHSV